MINLSSKTLVFGENGPEKIMTIAEILSQFSGVSVEVPPKPTPEPIPAPKPAVAKYGEPRTLVGTKGDHQLFKTSALDGLLRVFGDGADTFLPVGYNLDYTPLPGTQKPSGPGTGYAGNAAPSNFKKPVGYRTRYFGDDQAYYEQSDLPDEVKPVKPAPAPNQAGPVVVDKPTTQPPVQVDKVAPANAGFNAPKFTEY